MPRTPSSEEIPSIEITELGMTGVQRGGQPHGDRACREPAAVPLQRHVSVPEQPDVRAWQSPDEGGFDVAPPVRARASSSRPSAACCATRRSRRFVSDVAEAANINKPLPGGEEVNYYRWWDRYYFAQDEWRVRPSLTLNLGLRYELSGNNIQSLIDLNAEHS